MRKLITWNDELLEILCRVTSYKKSVLKHYIINLAEYLGTEPSI